MARSALKLIMRGLLPLALVCELLALISHQPLLSLSSGALLGLFFVWHWRSLMPYPRRLAVVTLTVLGYWLLAGEPSLEYAARLTASAAYYGAFIASLGLMHCLVGRLKQLGELHRLLLAGPRAMLYPGYLLSSFAISSIVSFGMLNLVCGTLDGHLQRQGITGERRRAGTRGVMVSALRGFALVPLLAPTSVGVAILTRELPSMTWSALLPYSALAALILLLIGWYAENRRLQGLISAPVPALEPAAGLSFNQLLLASLLGIGLIALVANLTWLSATQAAMLLVPLTVLGVLLQQTRAPRQALSEISDCLTGMRNEIFIFACSALLAGLVGALVPVQPLVTLFGTGPSGLFIFGALGMLSITALSVLGVAPIISISLGAALLAQLASHGVPALGPGVALLCGFSLGMLLSPYGASALLLARYTQLSTWRVAVGWNGRFVLWALPPLLLLPLLV